MCSSSKPRVGGGVVLVRRLVKAPPDSDMFQAATSGDRDWLRFSLKRALSPAQLDKQVNQALCRRLDSMSIQ